MLWCAGFAEVVKLDVEPLIDLAVDGMVLGADLLGGKPLLQRLRFSGRSILISATEVQNIVVAQPAVPKVKLRINIIRTRPYSGAAERAFAPSMYMKGGLAYNAN